MHGFGVAYHLLSYHFLVTKIPNFIITKATFTCFYLSFDLKNPSPIPSNLSFPFFIPTLVRVCNLRSCVNN